MQICDRFFKIATVSVASILLFGCASEPKVAYVDPTRVQARSTNYGISDLQMLAESMTRSLLQTRIVMNAPTPPLITVAPVKNKTDQYIDTALITSKIETQLLKSGQVQFTARATGMTNITQLVLTATTHSGKIAPLRLRASAAASVDAGNCLCGQ
jgi:PBP1b-binding outer membrane lipoprotein LpoB